MSFKEPCPFRSNDDRTPQLKASVLLLPLPLASFLIDTPLESIYILRMEYDKDKVDDLVLALLHLTSFREHGIVRAWKSHDWDALDRLCDKGFISDPKRKGKSVVLSDDGARKAQELFQTFCGS